MLTFKEFLLERNNFYILLENRVNFLRDKFGEKLSQKFTQNPEAFWGQPHFEVYFNALTTADPTNNKQYLQWIIQKYLANDFKLEDYRRVRKALESFEKNKPALKSRDINQYKTLHDLEEVLPKSEEEHFTSGKEYERKSKESANKLYEDENIVILIPKSEEAACYYGKGTKWCTAAKNDNMFKHYNQDGDLYILIDKKNNLKYQFHIESESYMDAKDHAVNIFQIFENYPQLKKVLQPKMFEHAKNEFNETGLIDGLMSYVRNVRPSKNEIDEIKKLLLNYPAIPSDLVDFVKYCLGDRWPEFEDKLPHFIPKIIIDYINVLYNIANRNSDKIKQYEDFTGLSFNKLYPPSKTEISPVIDRLYNRD